MAKTPSVPAEIPVETPDDPRQHFVMTKDDADRSLVRGDVIDVDADTARVLVAADTVRPATPVEVELAQPRVRVLHA